MVKHFLGLENIFDIFVICIGFIGFFVFVLGLVCVGIYEAHNTVDINRDMMCFDKCISLGYTNYDYDGYGDSSCVCISDNRPIYI